MERHPSPEARGLRSARFRAVIIRKIEVGDAEIKRGMDHLLHVCVIAGITEIVPETE